MKPVDDPIARMDAKIAELRAATHEANTVLAAIKRERKEALESIRNEFKELDQRIAGAFTRYYEKVEKAVAERISKAERGIFASAKRAMASTVKEIEGYYNQVIQLGMVEVPEALKRQAPDYKR